ncbi:MAG: hypothetical protein PHZ09_05130 [Eubacteriales bacterium]|nr:hypothetical protein [Eubacteriales bacterium]
MRYAIIDIGSNTVRMNIYDVYGTEPFSYKRILTECNNTGLFNYIDKRTVSEEGIDKLAEVLSEFNNIIENINCDKGCYFAAASLRSAVNKSEVLASIYDRLGINIELINGESEALLGFQGLKLTFGNNLKNGFMIDIGGASTELLGFVDGLAVRTISMPFGCLSLYKKFVSNILPSKDEMAGIKAYVDQRISEICWLKDYGDTSYLVGGTARATGKMHYLLFGNGADKSVHTMTYGELKAVFDYVKKSDEDVIKTLVRTIPDRLHTFIPGIYSCLRILRFAGTKNIIISPTGIREGFLYKNVMSE